jgi:hypothetical protein
VGIEQAPHHSLPGTLQVLALKVLCFRKLINPGQSMTVEYVSGYKVLPYLTVFLIFFSLMTNNADEQTVYNKKEIKIKKELLLGNRLWLVCFIIKTKVL